MLLGGFTLVSCSGAGLLGSLDKKEEQIELVTELFDLFSEEGSVALKANDSEYLSFVTSNIETTYDGASVIWSEENKTTITYFNNTTNSPEKLLF